MCHARFSLIFFFNDTATTEIYTLSLHDALPISYLSKKFVQANFDFYAHTLRGVEQIAPRWKRCVRLTEDRKSTRLNSSHQIISYAVFCLKKKNIIQQGRTGRLAKGSPGPEARRD